MVVPHLLVLHLPLTLHHQADAHENISQANQALPSERSFRQEEELLPNK